jgi:hypothetical protein
MARAIRMQTLLTAAAVIMCLCALGAFTSSASAYSLSSRGCTGSGGGTITKAYTDWTYGNIIMPARNITRAPWRCSTYSNQRIVVQYRLLYYARSYPYTYVEQTDSVSVFEGIVRPGGYLSMPEVGWGGNFNQVEVSPSTYYRAEVRVWWERPSNRAVYGYKIYYLNSNGDYTCNVVTTINGSGYCRVSSGAVMQRSGIWNTTPSL